MTDDLSLHVDDLSLHIFELPGIESIFQNRETDGLLEWLHFFSHPQPEGEDTMTTQYKNPMVNRALESLRALSADQKTRELAERREKAIKDEAMFLNEARRKGLEEGRKEGLEEGLEKGERLGMQKAATKLIQGNLLSMAQIAEVTGLKIPEIEELKRSLS